MAALVDYSSEARGHARLPSLMALGYIAAFSETLALAVIVSKGVAPLVNAVVTEPEDHIKVRCMQPGEPPTPYYPLREQPHARLRLSHINLAAQAAACWSLGQIGRHSPDHAKALADANVFPKLLAIMVHESSSDDLQNKAKTALKSTIIKCVHLPALEPLLHDAPENILKYAVHQFAKVLPHDVAARRSFVTSGGLQKVLELQPEAGSKLGDFVNAIKDVYPPEVVDYYSPSYSKTLLDMLDPTAAGE